jgi:hypothetical protein
MSSIRIKSLALGLLLSASLLSLSGCGDANSQATLDPYAGNHPHSWPFDHAAVAKTNPEPCKECHGDDLAGGISRVSCTQCHIGGPLSVHPKEWTKLEDHGSDLPQNGLESCKNAVCHGTNGEGVPSSGLACTTCHQ